MLREDRRLKLKKKYDARIDYIESTGTQWIDTGFKPNLDTKIVADMQGITSTDYGRFFGCVGGTSYNSAPTFVMNYETGFSGSLHFMWGSDTSWNINSNYSSSTATKRTVYTVDKNVLKVDGTTAFTRTYTSWLATTNLAIFSYMKTSGITTDAGEYLKGRLYNFQIYDNGSLIRDFIPVRVGTEACLYDKVTDGLFYNLGTGSFTYGGDVTPIEYLGSTGTLYINTGFYPNNDTKVDITYCATGLDTYGVPLGCTSTAATNNANNGLYRIFGGVNRIGFGNGTGTMVDISGYSTLNTEYNILFDKNKMYIDNTLLSTLPTSTWTSSYPLYLFTRNVANSSSYPLIGYIKYCKIYNNDLIVKDFIPAVAGTTGYMWDIENDILYSNAGNGNFKLSPDSGYVEPEYVFSASKTSISHAYGGASTNVTITSTADEASQGYYVKSKPSWVTTSISEGTLTITSSSNGNISTRSGTVIIELYDSMKTISISISLAAWPKEKVTVTTNIACTIYIGSNTSSSGVTSYTAYVKQGTNYTVSVSNVSGYDRPANLTFTAGSGSRSVTMTYTLQTVVVSFYLVEEDSGSTYSNICLYAKATRGASISAWIMTCYDWYWGGQWHYCGQYYTLNIDIEYGGPVKIDETVLGDSTKVRCNMSLSYKYTSLTEYNGMPVEYDLGAYWEA